MIRLGLVPVLCLFVACDGDSPNDGGGAGAGSGAAGRSDGGAGSAGIGGTSAAGGAGGTAGNAGSAGTAGSAGGGAVGGGGASGGSGGTGGTAGTGGSQAGSGGNAGTTMTDAGSPDGGPRGCAQGAFLLCEDFEQTAVNAIPSGWTKHGDPVMVADDAAASGRHSLKLGPIANGERRIYHDATSLPSTHFGRVRFKVKTPVPDAFVHSTLVTLWGRSPKPDMANLEVRVVDTVKESKQGFNNDGNGSHFQVLYNVQPQGRAEFGKGSSYDWKFDDAWHCAEWFIDSAQQAYRFFLDGAEIDDIAFTNGAGNYDNSEIPSQFREIRLGWNNYQSAPPGFTAWIDDFAIATQRITCAN